MMQTKQIQEKKIINKDIQKNINTFEKRDLSYLEKIKETWSVLTSDLNVEVGKTSNEVLLEESLYRLLYYKPLKKLHKTPLLIIYGLINRPYILDLQDDKSFIKNLLNQGFEVYLIEWKPAKYIHKYVSLENYLKHYMDQCIEFIRHKNSVEKITLLGYCMGSTMAIMYSSIYPQKVRNLITISPIIDTDDDSFITNVSKHINVDNLIDVTGNLPPGFLYQLYTSLKPYKQGVNKYLTLMDRIEESDFVQNFLRLEKWLYDAPPIAGNSFRQWLKDIYQQNLLAKNQMKIGSDLIDLSKIKMPILNIISEDDHLVSPSSSIVLENYVKSDDYTLLKFSTGHVGLIASRYCQQNVLPRIGEWLKARSKR